MLYAAEASCHNKTSYGFYYTIGGFFVTVRFYWSRQEKGSFKLVYPFKEIVVYTIISLLFTK